MLLEKNHLKNIWFYCAFERYKMRTLVRNKLTLFFPMFPFDSPENVSKPEAF